MDLLVSHNQYKVRAQTKVTKINGMTNTNVKCVMINNYYEHEIIFCCYPVSLVRFLGQSLLSNMTLLTSVMGMSYNGVTEV